MTIADRFVKAQQSKFTVGDVGYATQKLSGTGGPIPAGTALHITQVFAASRMYDVENTTLGYKSSVPEQFLTKKKPRYQVGDYITDYNNQSGDVTEINAFALKYGGEWLYVVKRFNGTEDLVFENEVASSKKKQTNQPAAFGPSPSQFANNAKFKTGDKVMAIDDSKLHASLQGMSYTVDRVSYDKTYGDWMYRVLDDQKRGWTFAERELKPDPSAASGSGSSKAMFKIHDQVMTPAGTGEVTFVSWDKTAQDWKYEIDVHGVGFRTLTESALKKHVQNMPVKKVKPETKFKPGDHIKFKHTNKEVKGIVQKIIGPEDKNYVGMLEVLYNDDQNRSVYIIVHPSEATLDDGQSQSFEDGDTVMVVVPGRSNQYAVVVNRYPTDADGTEWYTIQYADGQEEVIDGDSLKPIAKQPTKAPQQRQDYDFAPEETSRKDFHPSMQDLMSHIKDKGTPYFPPTPQGQKDFEQFLIQQHQQEMEDMKRNWGALAKKIGQVRADIIKKQQLDRLYQEAMKAHA